MKRLLVLVIVVAVGCSGSPKESATPTTTGRDQAVRFATCMRDNGITGFPDPDASGQLTVDAVANQGGVDTSTAAFDRAMAACRDLEPDGFTGHERDEQQQAKALAFARCIRQHGVEDFPDPTKDSPLVDTNHIPSSQRKGGMAILNAAMRTCSDLAKAAMEARQ